ncbi:hypothetical protein TFLX_04504 [Thermoflexales bacterium]|nr:hypothetical protein TFLX_04504 [Thermoflexales bacterium]
MNTSAAPASASQLKTIVTLFVILRVTILLMYTPQGLLNAYTDFQHYYRVARLSEQGYYPFINSWSEHPPLQAYTSQAVYSVVRSVMPAGDLTTPTYQFFARLLGLVMLIFETGVLILIHRITLRVWDMERANWLGWVYSALSVPLFYWNASQTSNFVFFTLLAVYGVITKKRAASAASLALGMLVKLTPVFLIGSVARFLWPALKPIIRYAIIVAVVFALAFVPFVAQGGTAWTIASLAANGARASWATPWALIDGNWGVGDVGDVPTRTQLELAYQVYGNPPVIPAIIGLILFGLIFLWLFRRPIDQRDPRHFIWFTTLTLLLFHLWSKGWSPQWAMLIIPCLLLSFPNQRGLRLVLIFTLLLFIEWPLSDVLKWQPIIATAILGRTALFGASSVLLFRALWPRAPQPTSALPRPHEDYIS